MCHISFLFDDVLYVSGNTYFAFSKGKVCTSYADCNNFYLNWFIEIYLLRARFPLNNLPFTCTGDCIDWKQLINVAWHLSQCT